MTPGVYRGCCLSGCLGRLRARPAVRWRALVAGGPFFVWRVGFVCSRCLGRLT